MLFSAADIALISGHVWLTPLVCATALQSKLTEGLFYGDNVEVSLKHIASDSIDLIYPTSSMCARERAQR